MHSVMSGGFGGRGGIGEGVQSKEKRRGCSVQVGLERGEGAGCMYSRVGVSKGKC